MLARIVLAAVLVATLACRPADGTSQSPGPPETQGAWIQMLPGTVWTALTIGGVAALPTAEPTIEFDAVGVRGSTGCNEWGGRPTFGPGGAFTVSEISMTKRACAPAVAGEEVAFLAAIRGATSIAFDGRRLHVGGPGGEIVLQAGVGIGGALDRA